MLRRHANALAAACALAAAMSACGGPQAKPVGQTLADTTSTSPSTTTTVSTAVSTAVSSTSATTTPPSVPTTTTTAIAPPATGRVVVIDPGHNGGNATHTAEINRQVPAGRGRTKPCNTTGTATQTGYPEHAFAWDLAVRLREILTARGVKVVMTRADNAGVGPCVDRRAAIGNESGAAAVVSLHADGSTAAGAHGFHLAYSSPPLNTAQGEPSLRLARAVRDKLVAAGFPTSNYAGKDGLSARDDLAGLNLTERPTVLVECGNMRDAAEAATLSSAAGRQRYAEGIANGILGFLG
ncbi:N-acetylmuramoyl-L-alanine amidase [Actinokineospora alba]|uniref:N-acetylmuramoyl-L-alanine amidase n=1 Tax=Actinokineospora alba TaxID=504798 RepID=UPI001E5D0E5A|nr:N-acetylmuramoyl-L-alanine amidase [Actinokineospora alba]